MENELIQNLRTSYTKGKLEIGDIQKDPIEMLKAWLQLAVEAELSDANAMTLATVNKEGQPAARIVLLKELMDNGLVFYTNYRSRKGKDLEENNKSAILFFWKELQRQIRIEGIVEKISDEDSKKYFQSRPKGSQIGAWASPQSKIINDRSVLDDRVFELSDVYREYEHLPRPPFWGGYRLIPHYFEFWQGRENRLHDRFEYRNSDDGWVINRLAP